MLDKIFKAYDVRAVYPQPLNEGAAFKVGVASGRFLTQQAETKPDPATKLRRTVLVSRDMRPHSQSLAGSLMDGLRAAGCDVIDLGLADTSMIYFAVNHLGAAGGIQVTASHNPVQYNGFKISGQLAKPIGASTGLTTIKEIAVALNGVDTRPQGKLEQLDLWAQYRKHVLSFYTPPKAGRTLKAFVDASNGMAGLMVPKIFTQVPGLEIVPLNFEHGPTVPFVHEPNPLIAANMVPTQQGVLSHRAQLGACFDGDADRCMLTDEKGAIAGCDHLTAMLIGHFVAKYPASTVVYDLRSSKAVEEAILAHGAKPRRSRVGHVFMKEALRDSQGCFGGELSGHFYFRDNFYADSGAIAFASVLSLLGQTDKSFSSLIAPYRKYPQSGEINFKVEDKAGVLATLKQKYAGKATIDELDGVTLDAWNASGGGWWFNVRASNTEPLLRFNAEAREPAKLESLLKEVTPLLGEIDHGH